MKRKFKGSGGDWFFKKIRIGEDEMISIQRSGVKSKEDDSTIAGIWDVSGQSIADAMLIVASKDLLEFAQAIIKKYPRNQWVQKEGEKIITKALGGEDETKED